MQLFFIAALLLSAVADGVSVALIEIRVTIKLHRRICAGYCTLLKTDLYI